MILYLDRHGRRLLVPAAWLGERGKLEPLPGVWRGMAEPSFAFTSPTRPRTVIYAADYTV